LQPANVDFLYTNLRHQQPTDGMTLLTILIKIQCARCI
jgi:hypothetical protein